ncbi:helix-turn-helix domain-containing protein [Cytobacillus sp. FSL R7-0696]|uniref:winged helix-turn-helix transcriptional regulator n=1 Tax=Cytobacillus sp. FSL R7-0696 TaxID=2921691 RepID=UPI0030F70A3C
MDCNHKLKTDSKHICSNYHEAIEFIGRRWMGMVIYSLMDGPKRFSELADEINGISDRLLTERLNELIKEELVNKTFLEDSSKKVEYALTERGMSLKKVIEAILAWIAENEK